MKRFSKSEFQATFRLYMQIWKAIINTDITRNVAVRREIPKEEAGMNHDETETNPHQGLIQWRSENIELAIVSMIKIMLINFTYCLEKHYRTGSSQDIKVYQQ